MTTLTWHQWTPPWSLFACIHSWLQTKDEWKYVFYDFELMKMERTCLHCNSPFIKKSKGYRRRSIFTSVRGGSECIKTCLENELKIQITPEKIRNICDDCFNLISKIKKLSIDLHNARSQFSSRAVSDYIKAKTTVKRPIDLATCPQPESQSESAQSD